MYLPIFTLEGTHSACLRHALCYSLDNGVSSISPFRVPSKRRRDNDRGDEYVGSENESKWIMTSDMAYSRQELLALGFRDVGQNVTVNRTCQFFSASKIRIGSNVRIDAFCFLSAGEGGIEIGNYVHLSTAVAISGAGGVSIEDFAGLSGRVSIFSSNDDYSGGYMTNPLVPDEFRNVTSRKVTVRRHAILGAGSVILPGVTVGLGASVGALTLVNRSIPDFTVVSGNPMRKIGMRDKNVLDLEARFLSREPSP